MCRLNSKVIPEQTLQFFEVLSKVDPFLQVAQSFQCLLTSLPKILSPESNRILTGFPNTLKYSVNDKSNMHPHGQ